MGNRLTDLFIVRLGLMRKLQKLHTSLPVLLSIFQRIEKDIRFGYAIVHLGTVSPKNSPMTLFNITHTLIE